MTDDKPDADPPASRRRGLWALMGNTTTPAEPAAAVSAPEKESTQNLEADIQRDQSLAAESATLEADTDQQNPAGRRGLWSLMGKAPVAPSVEETPSNEVAATPSAQVEEDLGAPKRLAAPRGLFSLMNRSASDEPAALSTDEESRVSDKIEIPIPQRRMVGAPAINDADADVDDDEFEEEGEDDVEEMDNAESPAPVISLSLIDPADLEPPSYIRAREQASRNGWISIISGVVAVTVSALAMLPYVWSGFPATAFGFAGIIAGYLTLTGSARRELPLLLRVNSVAGMLLGTIGIFLGPLFFAELGRHLREATGQQATSDHLREIGVAFNRYHEQHSAFPVGGTFTRDADGVIKGQHGWMTFLLPFIGEEQLYRNIDQSKPYDDPVNRAAMTRDVEKYFASGGDRSKIVLGLAVSHFAGVGGTIDDASGISHAGIFRREEAVRKEEVTDGLSNTMIVGELAGRYPPWGDPENWRPIGKGLNKDANGFGNSLGTGASFLMGDGSVRFLSNQTDLKLLTKMSTRDGGE